MILELGPDTKTGMMRKLRLTKEPYLTEGVSAFLLGNKGAGKSHALAVLAEEAWRNRLPFIYYDVNGDACSLRELGDDVIILGSRSNAEEIRKSDYQLKDIHNDINGYIKLCVDKGFSLVVDLSAIEDPDNRPFFLADMIKAHYIISGYIRKPVMVLIDEAHLFAPQVGAIKAQKESLRAMNQMMSDGRKRGIISISATQQITQINKSFIALMNLRLFGKITHHAHYKYIQEYLPFKKVPIGRKPEKILPEDMERLKREFIFCLADGNRTDYSKIRFKNRITEDLGKTPVIHSRTGERPSLKQLSLFSFAEKVDS